MPFIVEEIEIEKLKPHPKNYRNHPEDQLNHIKTSIVENDFYRNVVIANDNTILAGHGVVIASRQLNKKVVPCIRMPFGPDDVKAMKVLAGDNEISNMGEVNDRALSEILRQIHESQPKDGLMGTGFTPEMLANLIFVTRPQSEIQDFNAAAAWVGLPDYEPVVTPLKVIVSFENAENRKEFFKLIGLSTFTDQTKSIWWPEKKDDDVSSLAFEEEIPEKVIVRKKTDKKE